MRRAASAILAGLMMILFLGACASWNVDVSRLQLGMEPEELLRLKHITGFSRLFADVEYKRAWVTKNQIDIRLQHERAVREAGQ